MKLYNTLSRKKEQFVPLSPSLATLYTCGPTVYNYAHIGNMRAYVFMDLLRKSLRFNGFKLNSVMNITDVGHLLSDSDDGEDKIAIAAKAQKKTPLEIANYYTGIFFDDCKRLNIETPEHIAKATDYIQEMIDYVVDLVNKGYGYEIDDGIYFDISKFEGYGKLSRIKLDEQQAGSRVDVNSQKRNPYDFALWKKAEPNHIMQWDSPWGKGYPGWHIECSAMSRKILGSMLDIHTGGVDHIPIHHENEIAQSEAKEGKKTVNYWLHGAFMLVDGGKMSKSLGNTYTVSNLIERSYSPLAFRYFCLNAHYRKELNFTFEGLSASQTALDRLYDTVLKHKESKMKTEKSVLAKYKSEFENAIKDDLNIPMALGVLWTMLKEPTSVDIYKLAVSFDNILGLSLSEVEKFAKEKMQIASNTEIPQEILNLANERLLARNSKNWAESDRLRDKIAELGYTIKDTKDSYEIISK